VLQPFLETENFRQAIKDFNEVSFKSHDRRIREDVTFLMNNLCDINFDRHHTESNAHSSKCDTRHCIDQKVDEVASKT